MSQTGESDRPDQNNPALDQKKESLPLCNHNGKDDEKKNQEENNSSPLLEEILRKFIEDEQALTQADYMKKFYIIRLEQETIRQDSEYSSSSACNPCHYMRNRYRDILPYDHNRVILSSSDDNPDGYMNASVIKLPENNTKFIAAQAPLAATVEEWWQMIFEQDVELIVMLCKLMEMNKVKCERYWPENKGESLICGNFEITFVEEERFADNDYLLRTLKMDNTDTGESRIVKQLHYIEWPDHGCPTGENQLLNMIDKMNELHVDKESPILVHCSAGVGRTGTIIAVNHIREMLKTNKLKDLNLYELVMLLRKQRSSCVQTVDQYQFVHRCVAHYARKYLNIPEIEPEKCNNSSLDSEPVVNNNDVSDDSEDEGTAVPDFPDEPPAPKGPEREELGTAAS